MFSHRVDGDTAPVNCRFSARHPLLSFLTAFAFVLTMVAGFGLINTADAAPKKSAKSKQAPRKIAGSYSSIVIDAATGRVLHEDNADAQKYPASLTKMMTLYMIFDALDAGKIKLSTTWKVSKHAESMSPTKLGLDAGETIAVRDVILGLITKSANDAAAVAAEGLGGTEDSFGDMMTQRARRLGMANTTFQNASGLPDPGQVTTARDMARLSRALIRDFPHYYSYFSTPEFTYAGRRHANHNRLMNWYEGADGIKTGFIRASGFNLAASAVRENRRIIGVVMGGPSPVARDQYMGKLLDAGFARMPEASPDIRHATAPAAPALVAPALVASAPVASTTPISEPPSRAVKSKLEAQMAAAEERAAKTKTVRTAKADAPAKSSSVSIIAAAEAAAITPPTPSGGWMVQVGAFNRIDAARKAAESAARAAPGPLADAGIEISSLDRKKSKVHRARLVGLSEKEAKEACRILERRKQDCMIMAPSSAEARAERTSIN
jgi:D-alanyl-D-alanine carboxypeptidase